MCNVKLNEHKVTMHLYMLTKCTEDTRSDIQAFFGNIKTYKWITVQQEGIYTKTLSYYFSNGDINFACNLRRINKHNSAPVM